MYDRQANLYTAVKPLLTFSKIFGLYPIKVRNTEQILQNCSSNNIFDILWSATVMISLTLYSTCTMKMGKKPIATSELITEIGDMIYMIVSLLNALIIGLVILMKRKKAST